MNSSTLLSLANAAFRNKDFESAIVLYEDALGQAKEPLAACIRFNLDLALQRKLQLHSLRNDLQIELRPQHQLVSDLEKPERWSSLGHDPHFMVELQRAARITVGWYRIEFTIETAEKRNLAVLYPDYGEGFSEESSIRIRFKSAEEVTRIIKFERDITQLRFDPLDKEGEISILCFRIQPLSEEQALTAMLATLKEDVKECPDAMDGAALAGHVYKKYINRLNNDSGAPSYQQWIEEVELPSLPSEAEVKKNLAQMRKKPLISVVMPTYNTTENHLRTCIESVIKQSYPYWELCIADDASPQPHVRRVLEEYKQIEPRIKVVYRKENGHISRASNSALELAQGDYVALLDHDDELPQYALYFVTLAINQEPEAKVIYSDEDKIDEAGIRSRPHFKSDWNPDLFYSQNYVCHLGVYKRELLNRIGGFRTGVEGSQDQDLLLRCLPHVDSSQILHIPRVLYHWRATEGSTALASGEKSYTTEAGLKALRDYFSTINPGVRVEPGLVPNTYRLRWPIPQPSPLVSLLIPTRDKRELIETCVRSILEKTTYKNYEILILDNGSVEQTTLEFFQQIQHEERRVRVLRYDHPFNYSAINNFGVRHAKGEVIGLINNDIEVISPEWLTEMVSHAIRPDIGCVGAKLYYANDTIQHGGVVLGIGGVANHSHLNYERSHSGYAARLICTQNYSAVTAACLLVRRFIFLEMLGLDENNLKIAFNDVDFCLRVRQAGYRNLWTPFAELYHYESISRGREDTPMKKERFRKEVEFMHRKHGQIIVADPCYNINLTKKRTDFSLELNSD